MNSDFTPIFSGGTGRSGTTIVGKLLGKHSKVKCGKPYEIKFLTDVFSLTDVAYGMRSFPSGEISKKTELYLKLFPHKSYKARLQKFSERALDNWFERTNRLGQNSGLHLGISRKKLKSLLEKLSDNAPHDLERAAQEFFYEFVNSQKQYKGEANWMDTSPPNIMHSASISRLLPEAKFIEMKRNPLDTIASVVREPWGPSDIDGAMAWWLRRTEIADESLSKIAEDKRLSLRLEDLIIHDRENSYQALLTFLALEDEPLMRAYFDNEMLAEKLHENRWKRDFENPSEIEARFTQLSERSA
jgi:hypothetical protein